MKKEYILGWLLMLVVALFSQFLHGLVVVETGGGSEQSRETEQIKPDAQPSEERVLPTGQTEGQVEKPKTRTCKPVEAAIVAIIIGVLLRNLKLIPAVFDPGIKAFEKPLILGIILYGAALDFGKILAQGPAILITIVVTMTVGFVSIYLLGRAFKLPPRLAALLSVGTTICGGSAIAVTAPVIQAKEEETSYAITTIALWGMVAIVAYLLLAKIWCVTDQAFGIFAGTAIHSTPQVAGAGFIFSEKAGQVAMAVKLVRNCFMVPMAFAMAFWYSRSKLSDTAAGGKKINVAKAFPWFLFGFFIMAILGSKNLLAKDGFFTAEGIAGFKAAAKFLILMGLAGIGLNTRLASFKGTGFKPFIVGLIGSVIVASVSITLIWSLGL